jgi:predicted outer membrane lipoprotein
VLDIIVGAFLAGVFGVASTLFLECVRGRREGRLAAKLKKHGGAVRGPAQ